MLYELCNHHRLIRTEEGVTFKVSAPTVATVESLLRNFAKEIASIRTGPGGLEELPADARLEEFVLHFIGDERTTELMLTLAEPLGPDPGRAWKAAVDELSIQKAIFASSLMLVRDAGAVVRALREWGLLSGSVHADLTCAAAAERIGFEVVRTSIVFNKDPLALARWPIEAYLALRQGLEVFHAAPGAAEGKES